MNLTDKQKELISRFRILRISETATQLETGDWLNTEAISGFCSLERNGHQGNQKLVDFLQQNALQEDLNGESITYLVFYLNDLVMYFTLKCSLIYRNHIRNLDDLKNQAKSLQEQLETYYGIQNNDPSYEDIDEEDPDYWFTELSLSQQNKIIQEIRSQLKNLENKQKDYTDETDKSSNAQAEKSFPAIEIAYFCFNDQFRSKWETLQQEFTCHQHTLGSIIFWKFIVDQIEKIRQLVGCSYLICFAADNTEERSLVTHYTEFLGFEVVADEYGIIETNSIRGLPPLYQRIIDLRSKADDFFNNFNPDDDSSIDQV